MAITQPLFALQAVQMGLAQAQATNTAVSAARTAAQTFADEPTLVGIQIPVRPDPAVLSSEIVEELLSYEKLRTTPQELVRFSRWLNEKRFGVCFFTKAVEYLVDMRREDAASEEEVTQVRRLPARRIA
jgi:hypothetical protein